jgi:NTP pyrophosphatase (non-canonical NTP hydrolase)
MTNPPTPAEVAADLVAFYKGQTVAPAPAAPTTEPAVRGGVYTMQEAAQAAAQLEATIVPGSWRDLEMRGVPTIQWPEDVMEQFIADQSKPQPPMLSDPRIAAATLADNEARRALLEKQGRVDTGNLGFITRRVRPDGWYSDDEGLSWHNPAPHAAAPAPAPNQNSTVYSDYSANRLAEMAEPTTVVVDMGDYASVINGLVTQIHQANRVAGWWTDLKTGETLLGKDEFGRDRRNVGELLCLVHSEISEAMEGYRKNLMDDKLPHRSMLEVELADALIRIFDIAGAHDLDLGGAIKEKREFNSKREDHKVENRLTENGKKF